MNPPAATGDLVRTAVAIASGPPINAFLEWLEAAVRGLRNARVSPCGAAGFWTTTTQLGTVEIRPSKNGAMAQRRVLDFRPTPALEAAVAEPTVERLAGLDDADPLAAAFGRALAVELAAHGRASVGNFGTWRVGRKPTMELFVRFRPDPGVNQRL